MIIIFISTLLGITLFVLVGLLLSYILFPICNIIERISYSMVFSSALITITGFLLQILRFEHQIVLTLCIFLLILIFGLIILRNIKNKNELYKTVYKKDIWFIFLFSIIGTLWRYWFIKSAENFGGAYSYAGAFEKNSVPDLGFYTGIARDHANYFANGVLKSFFNSFSIDLGILSIFILVFLYLGFIYILFTAYRKDKFFAYLGVILLSLGPIEIFHSTLSFLVHAPPYITLFSLFLLFKSENSRIFWMALLLSAASAATYYTDTMIVILGSFGFLMALLIKEYSSKKSLSNVFKNLINNRKIMEFLIIFSVCFSCLIISSNMKNFTMNSVKSTQGLEEFSYHLIADENAIEANNNESTAGGLEEKMQSDASFFYHYTKYKDPYFLGFSAITWQTLFFLLCGATFILYLISKKNLNQENLDILLCLIPVLIISFGFIYKNYPTRAIDYVAFFGLMALSIPKKYYKTFLIISVIFIMATCVQVANDRKIFFENPQKELCAAGEIKNTLNGRLFSDQKFINNLVLEGYYNVTGADDSDPLLIGLFYTNDENLFLRSIETLKNSGVNHIAITKRMREKYILMLNYPKKHLVNSDLYEKNLQKVYDNGDVMVYQLPEIREDNDQKNI